MDALERLLVHQSFAELTVSELAREAGLTTGAIYRRFKDKADLLRAAFDRFYDRSKEITVEHEHDYPSSMTDEKVLKKYLLNLLDFTLAHIHLMRAANHIDDAHSFDRMVSARTASADWLATRLQSSKYQGEELRTRCRFVLRVATATYRDTFLTGLGTSERHKSNSEINKLVKELSKIADQYLGIR